MVIITIKRCTIGAILTALLAIGLEAMAQEDNERTERIAGWVAKLSDPSDRVRLQASDALINFSAQPNEQLISALSACLKDSYHLVRANCAIALSRSGPKAESALSALTDALSDKVGLVRGWVAIALGNLGPVAKPVLPKISELLRDPDAKVRRASAGAMVLLDTGGAVSAVPVLVEELKFVDNDPQLQEYVRDQVEKVLETLTGPAAASAIKALQRLLSDADVDVRRRAEEIAAKLSGK
ncbi:MAG: HEAT repeat domain-containing protein [Acidobacteriota bacterium]